MSRSYSLYLFEPKEFLVIDLVTKAERILNQLLNQTTVKLDLYFFETENGVEKKLDKLTINDKSSVFSYWEKSFTKEGGYILYFFPEYWEYLSTKPYYDFSIVDIRIDTNKTVFILDLAITLAAADIAGCEFLEDDNHIFLERRRDEDQIRIEDLLDKCTVKESCSLPEAIQKFYSTINVV